MSVADLHDLELVWPSLGPRDVIVTGTFDQWSASIHLVKSDVGYSGTVKVPWGKKVAYKFIVDGCWRCREDRPQEDDGHGNLNNILLTPEKPLVLDDPAPARLVIPDEREVHGDADNLVTAVEFLTPADIVAPRDSLPPLPIPSITVEGLTPVNESKLNTATATEGHGVFSAPETPEKREPAPLGTPTSWDEVPTKGDGSAPLPFLNGSGEAHDPRTISTPALTQGEPPTSPEATKEEAVPAASEPVVPEHDHPQQAAQVAPTSVPESAVKQAHHNSSVGVPQVVPVSQASTSSTPAPSTVTPKKRRSLLARIKHIFNRDHDKQGKKEKHKY